MKSYVLARLLLVIFAIPYLLIGITVWTAEQNPAVILIEIVLLFGAGLIWYLSVWLNFHEGQKK